MPKTVHTPREQLVCGKIDKVLENITEIHRLYFGKGDIDPDVFTSTLYLVEAIRYDCERMEQKLISRKKESMYGSI